MKHFFSAVLLVCQLLPGHAQKKLLFKKLGSGYGPRLICLTDHLDSFQKNKKFSFYCRNQQATDDILKTFTVGGKTKQIGGNNEVHIYLLKDKEIQPVQMMINPKYRNINTDVLGDFEYYYFDVSQLINAHNKYPVNYTCKTLAFDTKKGSDDFIAKNKNDAKLLCYEEYHSDHEGTGTLVIQKDYIIDHENKGAALIASQLRKLVKSESEFEFSIVTSWDEETFNYSVECSKAVFDKLNNTRWKKTGWKLNKFYVLTYWEK